MADIKWIKITTDIFDDEKILLIESLPDGDAIIVIWFKLLCLAGKQNNGGVFMLNDTIPYTSQMLATIFRRKEATVELALQTFVNFGMIEIVNNTITIPKWTKHQSIQSHNEYMKKYMSEYRKKQQITQQTAETNADESAVNNMLVNTLVNSKLLLNHKNKEERNKKKEINITSENSDDLQNITTDTAENIVKILAYLNKKTGKHFRESTKKTQRLIHARMNEGFVYDDFITVIDNMHTQWKGTKFEKYLQPSTLFGDNFESYLQSMTADDTQQKSVYEEYMDEIMQKLAEENPVEN